MAPMVVVTVGDQRQHDGPPAANDLLDVLLCLRGPRVDDHTVRGRGAQNPRVGAVEPMIPGFSQRITDANGVTSRSSP